MKTYLLILIILAAISCKEHKGDLSNTKIAAKSERIDSSHEIQIPYNPKSRADSMVLVMHNIDSLSSLLVDLFPRDAEEYLECFGSEPLDENFEHFSTTAGMNTRNGFWILDDNENNRDLFIGKLIAITTQYDLDWEHAYNWENILQLQEWLYGNLPDILEQLESYPEDILLQFWRCYFATVYPENNKGIYDRALSLTQDKYSRNTPYIKKAYQQAYQYINDSAGW